MENVILDKISELKTDIDRRLDQIDKKLEKLDDQNLSNRDEIIKLNERFKSIQSELSEHKNEDKDYGKDLSDRIKKIENQSWKIIVYLAGAIGGGAGIVSIIKGLL